MLTSPMSMPNSITVSLCLDLDFRNSCFLRANPPRIMKPNKQKTKHQKTQKLKQKNKQKNDRTQLSESSPLWGCICFCFGFLFFGFLVFWRAGKTKKHGRTSLVATVSSLGPLGLQTCLGLRFHEKTFKHPWKMQDRGKFKSLEHGLGNFVSDLCLKICQKTMPKHRQPMSVQDWFWYCRVKLSSQHMFKHFTWFRWKEFCTSWKWVFPSTCAILVTC